MSPVASQKTLRLRAIPNMKPARMAVNWPHATEDCSKARRRCAGNLAGGGAQRNHRNEMGKIKRTPEVCEETESPHIFGVPQKTQSSETSFKIPDKGIFTRPRTSLPSGGPSTRSGRRRPPRAPGRRKPRPARRPVRPRWRTVPAKSESARATAGSGSR